ncbi:hypothetical protein [Terricaulis sp.]|uniref:hypothetical protein n=1 Tax=Terricaulis sp. TaxID=2768686 RepID=UPI0037852BAF
MPPPIVCIDVKECARVIVDTYSAPRTKRLRAELETTILFLYPEDARDAQAGLTRLQREEHRQRFRSTFYVDFEGDGFVLKFIRKSGCWALFAGASLPPDDDGGDETDEIFGDEDGGGYDALQRNLDSGGDTATAAIVIITLDELISRKEMAELSDQRLRPAARSGAPLPRRRFLAAMGLQGLLARAAELWAKLNSRSRTLVRTEQAAAQTVSDTSWQARPLEAAIPAELSGIDETGFELVSEPVQVGPHLLSLRTWRRKSPETRRQRRPLFGKKTHNKRLQL